MIDAATVVWLVEGDEQTAPSEDAARALEAWGKEHGVKLAPPTTEGAPVLPIDWTAGETVEQGIARARDALAALDFDAAERELTRAEAVLREHPELPQAAWLLAEVERAWSVRGCGVTPTARPRRPQGDRSQRTRRARSGRGSARRGSTAGARRGSARPRSSPGGLLTATIRLAGHGAGTLRLDGKSIAPGEVKSSEGEHALAIVGPEPGAGATWAGGCRSRRGLESRWRRRRLLRARATRWIAHGWSTRRIGRRGCAAGRGSAAVAEADGVIRVATCQGETCARSSSGGRARS